MTLDHKGVTYAELVMNLNYVMIVEILLRKEIMLKFIWGTMR